MKPRTTSGEVARMACKSRARLTVFLLFTAGAFHEAAAQVQMPRFLPDAVAQFNALSKRPDAMGFEIGEGPDPSQCRHHQALLRTEAADGRPYFLVTRSGPPRDDCPEEESGGGGDPIANLYIVRMGSRDTHRERLRSNRLRRDMRTTETPPDPRDRVVRSIPYNGAYDGTRSFWPPYDHPGGMQQVGNIVAIGVEFPPLIWVEEPVPHQVPDPTMAPVLVQFVDVTDPENPEIRSTFTPDEPEAKAGVVALTPCGANRIGVPCESGRYLLAITGGSDNGTLIFYESTTNDLADPSLWWRHLYTWRKEELVASDVCTPRPFDPGPPVVPAVQCWHAHQTLQFLRERDLSGELYLAGARGGRFDPDFIDLYRVQFEGGAVRITQVATRHLVSHPAWEGENAGERIAHLAAASTFHVTPSGELLFYASEHDNDGPEGSDGRTSVKMGEWRHIEMVRRESPTLLPSVQPGGPYVVDEGSSALLTAVGRPPITKAWIQLYEHQGYEGRYLVIEYDDRNDDDFNDFRRLDPNFAPPWVNAIDPNGASDEASSLLWFAPVGCTIRANDDDFDDPTEHPGIGTRTLPGEGVTRGFDDLSEITNDGRTDYVENTFTSVQFTVESFPDCDAYYNAPISLLWDLDRDGQAESPGGQAPFFAEEGPAVVQIPVQATQGASSGVAHVAVTVNNVAPSIDSALAHDAAGRVIGTDVPFVLQDRPITFHSTFSDPGRLDHQGASLDWADGTVDSVFDAFSDAFGGVPGQLRHRHVYQSAGQYDILLQVTDDDQGTARAVTRVAVLSPGQAVAAIIELLDALITSTADGDARHHLRQARKALAGDVSGFGSDGALHKIAEQQIAAALAHLQNALADLARAQAAGANVVTLIGLIEEVVAALSTAA